jgi:hypothetical protein
MANRIVEHFIFLMLRGGLTGIRTKSMFDYTIVHEYLLQNITKTVRTPMLISFNSEPNKRLVLHMGNTGGLPWSYYLCGELLFSQKIQ